MNQLERLKIEHLYSKTVLCHYIDSQVTHVALFVLIREGQRAGETLSEHFQSSGLHRLNQPLHWHATKQK